MKVTEITSADNQKLKLIRSLAQGVHNSHDLILLEGHKLIEEALDKKIKLNDVVISQTYYQDNFDRHALANNLESIIVVKDNLFKGLYTTDTSCGIIATAVSKLYALEEIIAAGKSILLGDNIQDPGNVGTIIRTAFAFNAGGFILSKGSADCYGPKVIRASMGAVLSLPIIKEANLVSVIKEIKKNNFYIIALDGAAKKTIWEKLPADKPAAYILGNEGHGISADVLKSADSTVSIPINPNCESLNVAIAAGIILAFSKVKQEGNF